MQIELLDEFMKHDFNEYVRRVINDAICGCAGVSDPAVKELFFDRFNVYVNCCNHTILIEDDLNFFDEPYVLSFEEFDRLEYDPKI